MQRLHLMQRMSQPKPNASANGCRHFFFCSTREQLLMWPRNGARWARMDCLLVFQPGSVVLGAQPV
jgi:hypothetical protein